MKSSNILPRLTTYHRRWSLELEFIKQNQNRYAEGIIVPIPFQRELVKHSQAQVLWPLLLPQTTNYAKMVSS